MTRDDTLPLLAVRSAGGGFALNAPRVGVWKGPPHDGAIVGPGSPAGTLVQLARHVRLVVPEGVVGRVEGGPRDRAVPVAYGETLFRVVAVAPDAAARDATGLVAAADASGTYHVPAPTDGVIYLSPSPGERAYVRPGQAVRPGQPIGLIEVMKTFNPVLYGGGSLPEDAEIVEVLAEDGQDVRAGQTLMTVRPRGG